MRRPITKADRKPGSVPYYGASTIVDYVSEYIFDEPLVLVGEDGAKWGAGEATAFRIDGKTWVSNHAHVLRPDRSVLIDRYLELILVARDLSEFVTGMTVPKLTQARLNSITLAIPPLAEQPRIVAKVDDLMALCDRLEARQQDAEAAYARLVARERADSSSAVCCWPERPSRSVVATKRSIGSSVPETSTPTFSSSRTPRSVIFGHSSRSRATWRYSSASRFRTELRLQRHGDRLPADTAVRHHVAVVDRARQNAMT